jgi:hypothetical protein
LPFWRRGALGFSGRRVLLLTHDNPICHSQIYPFYYYRRALARRYGVALQEECMQRFLKRAGNSSDEADIVMLQPWFTMGEEGVERLLSEVERRCRPQRIVVLDPHAPTDLRFAKVMGDRIAVYVKKHALRDRAQYGQPTRGDTNVTDFCAARYNLELPRVQFEIPEGFLRKLVIGPSFATADYMLGHFLRGKLRRRQPVADIHARLGKKGTEWYSALRREAIEAAESLSGARVLSGSGVPKSKYLEELGRTRLCFSPFGYGEVAWRDYEAVMCGSLLIKPDMGHIETEPDIFVAGETYVPVRWDLGDFTQQARHYLLNEDEREHMVQKAFDILSGYFTERRFVDQMAPVFQ